MRIEISENSKYIRSLLKTKLKRVIDLGEPLHQIGTVIYKSVIQNFRKQGRPFPWRPLSPLTLFVRTHRTEKRARAGNVSALQEMGLPARPLIMMDTGMLIQSIYPGRPGNVFRVDKSSVAVGTNIRYAPKLQFGGTTETTKVKIGKFTREYPRTYKGRPVSLETIEKRTDNKVKVEPFEMTIKGGKRIPPRPFLMIQRQDTAKIFEIMKRWIFGLGWEQE